MLLSPLLSVGILVGSWLKQGQAMSCWGIVTLLCMSRVCWAGGAFTDLANWSHIGLFTSWYFVKDTISKIFHEHLFV